MSVSQVVFAVLWNPTIHRLNGIRRTLPVLSRPVETAAFGMSREAEFLTNHVGLRFTINTCHTMPERQASVRRIHTG